jgi:NAD+ diphosphatase
MEYQDYISFMPGVEYPLEEKNDDLWFIFNSGKLAIEAEGDSIEIPLVSKINKYKHRLTHIHYVGQLEGKHCYAAEIGEIVGVEKDFSFGDLRTIMPNLAEDMFFIASRAIQIINWDKEHKYCGRCGVLMHQKSGERVKLCPSCGLTNYPRISPAIIVAVTKGNELLLAHNKNFRPGMFSVIAGFVDAGETFEECVKREVMEEVGIKVKNIKYFKSQPWPFPNSLMIGFTAEYESGEITPDGVEIEEAHWYTADKLPSIPSKVTISGKLINWFVENSEV